MKIIINTVAIAITAYILPGVVVANVFVALIVAVVLGIINMFLRPILVILTLPINVLTLGLFTFVINGLLVMLASSIIPGFHIDGFWTAVLFSIITSVISGFLDMVI
jgi:putative membrane protein